MGQIAFFRSGNEPIVLNEQQRNSRREACIKQLTEGKSINNRFSHNIPNLGRIQFQQQQQQNNQSGTNISGVNGDGDNLAIDSNDSNCDKQSLIIRNNECVICMDNQRGNRISICFAHSINKSIIRLRSTSMPSSVRLHQMRPSIAETK